MKPECIPFSKELALLACCAEKELSPRKLTMIRESGSGGIDWDRFLALSIKNRVCPIVYKNLSGAAVQGAEQKTTEALKERCIRDQRDSLRLTAELIRVMGMLELAGIRAISLKGPLLGLFIYQDLSLRPSKDLDILIAPSDFQKAEELLIGAGYRKETLWQGLSAKQQAYLRTAGRFHHVNYINGSGVEIELHWRYCAGYGSVPFEEAWANRADCSVGGKRVPVLNGEEHLIYLIYHGSEHAWKRLRWLCDVHELIRKGDVDWGSVMEKAGARRMLPALAQTFILLERLFDDKPPGEIMTEVPSERRAWKLASMAVPFLEYTGETGEHPGQPQYRLYRRYMSVWNNEPFPRIRSIMGRFCPGPLEFQALKISDRLFFLYYVFRPIYKSYRYVRNLLKKLWSSENRSCGLP